MRTARSRQRGADSERQIARSRQRGSGQRGSGQRRHYRIRTARDRTVSTSTAMARTVRTRTVRTRTSRTTTVRTRIFFCASWMINFILIVPPCYCIFIRNKRKGLKSSLLFSSKYALNCEPNELGSQFKREENNSQNNCAEGSQSCGVLRRSRHCSSVKPQAAHPR